MSSSLCPTSPHPAQQKSSLSVCLEVPPSLCSFQHLARAAGVPSFRSPGAGSYRWSVGPPSQYSPHLTQSRCSVCVSQSFYEVHVFIIKVIYSRKGLSNAFCVPDTVHIPTVENLENTDKNKEENSSGLQYHRYHFDIFLSSHLPIYLFQPLLSIL